MNKAIGMALLAVGVVLIVMGVNVSNSISSDFSRTFTGAPTNKTLWLLIGGVAAAVVGAALTFMRSHRIHK